MMNSQMLLSKALVAKWTRYNGLLASRIAVSAERMAIRAVSTENKPPLYGIHSKSDCSDFVKESKSSEDSLYQNHIWSAEEIRDELKSLYRHKPVTLSDKIMRFMVSYYLLVKFELNYDMWVFFFSDAQLVQDFQLRDGLPGRQCVGEVCRMALDRAGVRGRCSRFRRCCLPSLPLLA